MSTRKKRPSHRAARPEPSPGLVEALFAPKPLVHLEVLRIAVPLAVLGFMSSRIAYAEHWLGDAGFRVPNLEGTARQPLYLPSLPAWLAWTMATAMVASGLSVAVGFLTRYAAGIFAFTLFWVALADRLSAFTVSKLGAVLVLAIALSPAGARYSVDAYRRARRGEPLPTHVSGGVVLFFRALLVVMYCASGICKARGDWLETPHLLFTHLHGSYQTPVAHFAANHFPSWSWNVLQGITLTFEAGAPLWFALSKTRPYALAWGLAMHALIGLMFGPVIWFSLLMSSLLVGCFVSHAWLERMLSFIEPRAARPEAR
jgi:hypothetical protein